MAVNNKLSPYQAKRDFTKTAEPSGENAVAPSEVRRSESKNTPQPAFTMISVSNSTAY